MPAMKWAYENFVEGATLPLGMKVVTAADCPGATLVVAIGAVSSTRKTTLRSTVNTVGVFDTEGCATPPTEKLTVAVFEIVLPAVVPAA